jgi:oxalate decarboxylase/phosphoglucose isomerase-like protein (cupin superfamily)
MTPAMGLLISLILAGANLFALPVPLPDAPVDVDNHIVRVIHGTDMPRVKSPRHRHEFNRVMVYLDGGDLELTFDDGRKEEQHWKAGDVAWSPADGYHISENTGSNPMHMVEIELKQPGPVAARPLHHKLDAVAIDPTHNILLFENDQARVIRSWREPGGSESMHEHTGRGRVTVLLTDLDAIVTLPDGSTSTQHGSPGDVLWSDGPVTHSSTNAGANRLEVVVVEVK